MSRLGIVALAIAIVCLPGSIGTGSATSENASGPTDTEIAAVYPNPLAEGDAGEFVTIEVDGTTSLSNLSLADDNAHVSLPKATVSGRVVLSTVPNRTRELTDERVLALSKSIALANAGETVELRRDNRTVDAVSYEDAPEGERLIPTQRGPNWRPIGATDFPVVTADTARVRTFVLPDDSTVVAETLAGADERVLLAGYTFTSRRVVGQLVNASERGVDVRVLVDSSPVGGLTRREATALDRLAAANVSITVLGGEGSPYEFHHAKYAVVDDRALVTTENWKPAGTGGHGSRGWGVVVQRGSLVSSLADTFRADASGRDTTPWPTHRADARFETAKEPPANSTYPTRFPARRPSISRVELLRAPDNAERRVIGLLDNASTAIRVEQVSIGGENQPFLRATVRAARRGVDVRILLSSAWYVREDNRALTDRLNQMAAREDLPLEARLVQPRGRFEKVHAKGVLVDGERVILGSLNWNNHSARENREVAVVLHGEEAADYYGAVFRADWRGGIWRLPVGVAVAVALGALLAVAVGTRIEFRNRNPVRPGGGRRR